MIKLFLLLILLVPVKVLAYAHFIGHGYTSCLNCHYTPFGGGQLNDYGRAVSATAISSRDLYPNSWDEEKIAYTSGFLFRKPKQNWLRTQINYRGFEITQNPGSSKNQTKQWITMQADVRATLKFGENDKFIISGDYGKAPSPLQGLEGEDYQKYRSRNHFLGFRPTPKLGIYAGLMDKVYGLRVIEHTAFSRTSTQTTQNDQTHGLAAHYLGESWEGGVHAFVGNLVQDEEFRMKGFSSMVEKTIFDSHRVGASVQSSKNNFIKLDSYSLHARLNLKDGAALLAEVGESHRKTENETGDRTSRFGLLQTYVRPWRGIYLFSNIEYLKNDTSIDNYAVRWGPGIQYFPIQRVELRADIYNTRNFAPSSSVLDTWTYLYQVHVWL